MLTVHVIPRSPRPGFAGTRNGALLVRLAAPPVDNAANEELIALLARATGSPRRQISIVPGERGRRKRLQLAGADARVVATAVGLSSLPHGA